MDSSAGSRVSAGDQDDADGDRERRCRGRSRTEKVASSRVSIAAITVARGERDRLADPGDRADDRLPGRLPGVDEVASSCRPGRACPGSARPRWRVAGPQFLPDPEHQEQPVVGARAKHQHDQQQLGDAGTPGARAAAASATSGPAMVTDSSGGMHGDQSERERSEDQYQQHDDEQQRQSLHLVAGVAGRFLLVHLRGDVAGQVRLQPGRQPGLGDLGTQAVYQVGGVVRVAAALLCQHDQLLRVTVGGPAGVEHLAHPGDQLQPGRQPGERGGVSSRQRRAGPGRHHGNRLQGGGAERRGELGRLLAGGAGGQELGVVVLGHAVQRGQLRHGGNRPEYPDKQHQPAEPDDHGANRSENRVDVHGAEFMRRS